MNLGFWSKLKIPFTVLAPMANVTDFAFRQIVTKCGRPDVFYTEFISASKKHIDWIRNKLFKINHIDELMKKFDLRIPSWWLEVRKLNIDRKFIDT